VLEVNAIYFVLLVEGFALLLILVLLWVLIAVIRLRRKGKAIRRLAQRFDRGMHGRRQQTQAFLLALYRPGERDLQAALEQIERHESEFIQLLLEVLRRGRGSQIDGLDGALFKWIESYKCLQPRTETKAEQNESRPLEIETVRREVEALRGENDDLRNELCAAQSSLDDMLAEFGNMFGGGKEHELDLHDLKKKLAALQPGSGVDIKPME